MSLAYPVAEVVTPLAFKVVVAFIPPTWEDFKPSLTTIQVDVVPDYEKQRWEIGIVAYNDDLAVGVNTKVTITNVL